MTVGDDAAQPIPVSPDQARQQADGADPGDAQEACREAAFFDAMKDGLKEGGSASGPDPLQEKEIEKRDQEIRALREANDSLKQDREQRRLYSKLIYILVVGWLVILFVVLSAAATKGFSAPFELSEKVLLLLIGSTTINVLGLFLVVANYLFPKSK